MAGLAFFVFSKKNLKTLTKKKMKLSILHNFLCPCGVSVSANSLVNINKKHCRTLKHKPAGNSREYEPRGGRNCFTITTQSLWSVLFSKAMIPTPAETESGRVKNIERFFMYSIDLSDVSGYFN